MKKILFLAIFFLTALPFLSNAAGINFSITLTDAKGAPQPDTDASLRLSVIPDSETATPVYIETQRVKSNPYGVAALVIGEGAYVAGNWDEIDWNRDAVYLKVERAAAGSGSYSTVGIMRFGAAPYAHHAESASRLVLTSPDGSKWEVGADADGNVTTTRIIDANEDDPAYGTVDYIFDIKALPTITLEVSTDEWNNFLKNYDSNPQNEECVHADFIFNKNGRIDRIDDIGLRLRGNTSRRRPEGSHGEAHKPGGPFNHVHFGFRFAKFNKDDAHKLSGTDRFNLRWAKDDPTYCHEMYGYDLMRRFGVYTTARASYCRVYLKIKEEEAPAYLGVYEMFEAYDDQYLDDLLAAGKIAGTGGHLWKGGWGSGCGADFSKADRSLMGIENVTLNPSESASYTYDFKGKKKRLAEATDQLVEFITNLNTLSGDAFKKWAGESIDVDLLLRALACEVAVGHWDDVIANGNNYYIYFDNDGDGRMKFIPYDLDNTLGTSGSAFDAATRNPLEWGESPLYRKILGVDEYRTRFINYLKQLADPANDFIDPDKSRRRIKEWHNLIRKHVDNDTGQDTEIIDRPAGWSSTQQYRLLSDENNFFKAKINSINSNK